MPTTCAAFGCTNNSRKNRQVTFHRFPSNPKRRLEWLKYVNRENFNPSLHTFLCSKHFEESCFDRTGQTVRLRVNAVPTIFIYPEHMLEKISLLKKARALNTEEDPPANSSKETEKQKDLCIDHNYCLPSPKEIKRKICELERNLELSHKIIKLYQQRERRFKKKFAGDKVISSILNESLTEKASREVL